MFRNSGEFITVAAVDKINNMADGTFGAESNITCDKKETKSNIAFNYFFILIHTIYMCPT